MKKIITFNLSLLSICISSFAQWSTPIQQGNGLFAFLGAEGDSTVHIAYGQGAIYYKRSTNEGATWSAPVYIGAGTIYYDRPISIDKSNVYIVYFRDILQTADWCCSRDMGSIYMRRSTDGGVTWQPEVQISSSQKGYRVSVIGEGANVYCTWMDYRSGTTWDIYYRHSADSGKIWQPEVKLVSGINSFGEERPDIIVRGNSVHLFWMGALDNLPGCLISGTSYTLPFCSEVYYKRSLDGGNTWGPDIRLDTTNVYGGRPIATILSSDTIIVCWEGEDGSNELEPYAKRSTDNGTTWGGKIRLRTNINTASHPYIASRNSNVHIAWFDTRISSNMEIYYISSADGGVTWSLDENVSNYAGNSSSPIIGTTNNYVHLLWTDDRSGSYEPWYSRKFAGAPTSIKNPTVSTHVVALFPNPVKDQINLPFEISTNSHFSITGVLGNEVINVSIGEKTINVHHLLPGMYILKLKSNDQLYWSKFIKE